MISLPFYKWSVWLREGQVGGLHHKGNQNQGLGTSLPPLLSPFLALLLPPVLVLPLQLIQLLASTAMTMITSSYPRWCSGKESAWIQEMWAPSLGQEVPLKKEMTTCSKLLPGEFHGQRRLVGYSPWGRKELDTTENTHTSPWLLINDYCFLLPLMTGSWVVEYDSVRS